MIGLTGVGSAQLGPDCPSTLQAYWKLDEADPDSMSFEDSFADNEASCAGECPQPALEAKIGEAWEFTCDAVNPLNSTGLNAPGDDFDWGQDDSFSVEFWMKKDPASVCTGSTAEANEVVVGRDGTSVNSLHWWVGVGCSTTPQGVARFVLNSSGGSESSLNGTRNLIDGKWHHIVAVRDGVAKKNLLYVDGRLEAQASKTYTSGFAASGIGLNIGWLNLDGGFHYSGVLDEVAVYDGALSPSVIRGHYYLARDYCLDCNLNPVKIMPLGDSITQGNDSGADDAVNPLDTSDWVAYRLDLWDGLFAQGFKVDFVGSQQGGGANVGFDTAHEGHGGYTTADVKAELSTWLAGAAPEVILLHIGTNNISENQTPAGIDAAVNGVNGVAGILSAIDSFDPDITVLLARIVNRACSSIDPADPDCAAKSAATTSFNAALQTMADARIASGDKIIVVDMEPALDYAVQPAGDMWTDGFHPYATGYSEMADVWQTALATFLPGCSPAAPAITSTPVTDGFVGVPYSYTVTASGNPNATFSLDNPPAGMKIDATTGVISWTPSAADTFAVTVRADNGVGTAATQSFNIVVSANPQCTDGITSYWELGESTGSVYTDFFGTHDASCLTGQCPTATTGQIGFAQQFNGTTAGLSVPASTSFDWTATGSFTVEYWMKKSTACTGNEVAIGRDGTLTGSSLIWWSGCWGASNTASFVLVSKNGDRNDTEHLLRGTTPVTDGGWHHIAVVRDGASGQNLLYVDGNLEDSTSVTYTAGFDSPTAPLNIGWLNLGSFYRYDGALDDMAIFGRALSQAEIQEHYGVGKQTGIGYCHGEVAPVILQHPADATAATGQTATFSVVAASRTALTYQWQKNGANITQNGTGASYTTPALVAGDHNATYRCVVTNGGDSVTSNPATLTVNVLPIITTQPASQTVIEGQAATFTVAATGSGTLTYQWQKNGENITSGGTGTSYTTPAVTSADHGATYRCIVTNGFGSTATSSDATLSVNVLPVVTTQPADQAVIEGETATFSVAATGSATLTYQWQKNGVNIAVNGTGASYTTPPVTTADHNAAYRCVVTNGFGSTVASNNATLQVNVPPTITTQPVSQAVNSGQQATFSVAATGSSLSYQWKKDGVNVSDGSNIQGATTPTLTIFSTTPAEVGSYTCTASNTVGSETSAGATLTVLAADITILAHPSSVSLVEGYPARFMAKAKGTVRGVKLTYQWEKDGVDIPGAIKNSLKLAATAVADNGAQYRCRVINQQSGAWVWTNAATLSVAPIVITAQPKGLTGKEGKTVRFNVKAKGPKGAKLLYQWYLNGSPIAGAVKSSLSHKVTAADQNGQFVCEIRTSTGSGILQSSAATLLVTP